MRQQLAGCKGGAADGCLSRVSQTKRRREWVVSGELDPCE